MHEVISTCRQNSLGLQIGLMSWSFKAHSYIVRDINRSEHFVILSFFRVQNAIMFVSHACPEKQLEQD